MTTRLALQTAVTRRLDRVGDLEFATDFATMVQRAEARFRRELRLSTQERITTLTTVADSSEVALPTDFLQARSVSLNSNTYSVLQPITADTLREGEWAHRTGQPVFYSIENFTLQLRPNPSAGTEITLLYFAQFAPLENDADSNWLTVNAFDFIMDAVLVEACKQIHWRDLAAEYEADYQRSKSELIQADDDGRFAGGPAISTGVVHGV